jgi:hypothetical protein
MSRPTTAIVCAALALGCLGAWPAMGYKVERVCEEKQTRAGSKTVCRTVRVPPATEKAPPPAEAPRKH